MLRMSDWMSIFFSGGSTSRSYARSSNFTGRVFETMISPHFLVRYEKPPTCRRSQRAADHCDHRTRRTVCQVLKYASSGIDLIDSCGAMRPRPSLSKFISILYIYIYGGDEYLLLAGAMPAVMAHGLVHVGVELLREV